MNSNFRVVISSRFPFTAHIETTHPPTHTHTHTHTVTDGTDRPTHASAIACVGMTAKRRRRRPSGKKKEPFCIFAERRRRARWGGWTGACCRGRRARRGHDPSCVSCRATSAKSCTSNSPATARVYSQTDSTRQSVPSSSVLYDLQRKVPGLRWKR